jgi:hypothetical protein
LHLVLGVLAIPNHPRKLVFMRAGGVLQGRLDRLLAQRVCDHRLARPVVQRRVNRR